MNIDLSERYERLYDLTEVVPTGYYKIGFKLWWYTGLFEGMGKNTRW